MKDVWVLGDIHCDFSVIASWIVNNTITNSIIIQVGDFGIGFNNNQADYLKQLDFVVGSHENKLIVIRGNHDNPSCFAENNNVNVSIFGRQGELDASDLQEAIRNLKHIQLLPDYTVLNINDEKWLFVGGAISIDRKHRSLGSSYWMDEIFVYDEQRASEFEGIDRVVAHTSPDFCPPVKFGYIVYAFAKDDNHLLEELKYEREQVTKLFAKLKEKNNLKGWMNGHFHDSSHMYHGSTEFICLNINEFKQILGKDDGIS